MADTSLAIESWFRAHDPALFTGANSMHTASALRAAAAVDAANAEAAPSGSALPALTLTGASVAGAGVSAAQQLADAVSRCLASGGTASQEYLAAFAAAPATALVMMANLARQRAAFEPATEPPTGAQFNRYTTALGQNPLLSLQASGSQTAADADFSTSDALLASIASFLGGPLPGNVATGMANAVTRLGQSKTKTSMGLTIFLFGIQISGSDGRSGITLSMSGSTWQLVYAPPSKKTHDKPTYSANNTGVVVASFAFNTALWTPEIVARVGTGVTSIPSFADWVAKNSTAAEQ